MTETSKSIDKSKEVTVKTAGPTYAPVSIPLEDDPFLDITKGHQTGLGDSGSKSEVENEKDSNYYGKYRLVEPPYNLNNLAKIYEKSPSQMAAVDAKVSGIVGQGFKFVESNKTKDTIDDIDGKEDKEKARRTIEEMREILTNLLEAMNGLDQFIETLTAVVTDLEAVGNGYIEVGRNRNGSVGYIGHIPATSMRIRVQKDGFVQMIGTKATFFRNYGQDTVDPINDDPMPNEIIHFKHHTPTSIYYGIPKIVSALHAVAGEIYASEYNLDFFQHKAIPKHMIVFKNAEVGEMTENDIDNFLQTNSQNNHHRTLVVALPNVTGDDAHEPEIEVVPIGPAKNESSFEIYKSSNKAEILLANRVPSAIVDTTGGQSLGATRDGARIFREQVCRPIQRMLQDKLQTLFREITTVFDFNLNELTLTDEETMSRVYERYLRWGALVPNEVRAELGKRRADFAEDPVSVMAQAELKTKTQNEAAVQSTGNRTRDQERTGGPDTAGSDRTRAPSGEGRQTG